MLRWNFSSRARELSGADALVISIPKSGRTWLRTFLCAYFCRRYGHEFSLEPERYGDARIPRVIYSHDLFEQRTKADGWDRIRGKYLIPRREIERARIILLARDPRDAFVSLHIQLTRRTRETPEVLKQKSASELLRDPAFGIESIIAVMNAWIEEFARAPDFTLIRYEALRNEPEKNFRDLLAALNVTMDAGAFAHALQFSEFGNMQKLEAAGAFHSKILRAGDVADPESFKVRRGEIGGYREYLSQHDQAFAAAAMKKLSRAFGY